MILFTYFLMFDIVFGYTTMNLNHFEHFLDKYQKKYTSQKDKFIAYENFKSNLERIQQKNRELSDYKLNWNQFSDQNIDQLQRRILCNDFSSFQPKNQVPLLSSSNEDLHSIDWNQKGLVRPIKDQGNCGSCWAFSAVGALESMIDLHLGIKEELSEQQLIDCSLENYGCEGGWMHKALQYIHTQKGAISSTFYPYDSSLQICREHQFPKIKGSSQFKTTFLPPDSPSCIKKAIQINPICVAVHADFDFVFYQEGIFNKPLQSQSTLNHGILLIGYQKSENIWSIKNSWGVHWGENGFMRMSILPGKGVAGLHSYAVLPIYDPQL